ncbi:Gfo/Idh/MocA family oxidoreductase [Alphaproteobacteria bacterium]|nr:Gfo/Idh/MocA family oxidoreductase [Alphaproteobacteria bacterium]
MKKLNIGWVGSGFVGQLAHLQNYINNPNVNIIALAELRPILGQNVCNKFGIKNLYNNHLELMKHHPDLDGIVAIVNRKHTVAVAKDILKKGFNLFTEKPIAANSSQAKELVDLADKNKCIYVIGNMRRFDEGVNLAKKNFDSFVKSKELGKLISFVAYCNAGGDYCNIDGEIKTKEIRPNNLLLPIAPRWIPKTRHKEFEKFLNYFTHDINLIRYFFGDKIIVKSSDINKNSINVLFKLNGYSGIFQGNYLDQNLWDEGIDIYFTKGIMKLKLPPAFLRNQPATVEIIKGKNNLNKISPKADWTWSFQLQAKNFLEVISKKKQSTNSGKDTFQDIKLIEEIWKHSIK